LMTSMWSNFCRCILSWRVRRCNTTGEEVCYFHQVTQTYSQRKAKYTKVNCSTKKKKLQIIWKGRHVI
jgi:hypothetical protein